MLKAKKELGDQLSIYQQPENKGKRIVTTLCDVGDRYLSTILFRQGDK